MKRDALRVAVVGVGRIGRYHARHVMELAEERPEVSLTAVSDTFDDTAERVAAELGGGVRGFRSTAELVASGLADVAIVASRSEHHDADIRTLVGGGMRVLAEKPVTHSVETARALLTWLAEHGPDTVMLAFMRRYDAPLVRLKAFVDAGSIGTIHKVVSVLEDPGPPPDGYSSPGILMDMAVHNADEVLWLTGLRPDRVSAFGNRIYGHTISNVKEDFDDAFFQLRYPKRLVAQVWVSRNHVAGYRNETWVYGDRGFAHVGGFTGTEDEVLFEAFDPTGRVASERFELRDYGADAPVFMQRFGLAYRAEVAAFLDRCLAATAFDVTAGDGWAALEVTAAATAALSDGAGDSPVALTPPV